MSAATPDYIVRAIWNQARGIGDGPLVTRAEARKYMLDLGGWFSYYGDVIDISVKNRGVGLVNMVGVRR